MYYAVIENDNCLVYNVLSRFPEQSAKQICFLYLSLGIHPSALCGFRDSIGTCKYEYTRRGKQTKNICTRMATLTVPNCRKCIVTVGSKRNVTALRLQVLTVGIKSDLETPTFVGMCTCCRSYSGRAQAVSPRPCGI
jgi:hypothetical protein